MNVESLPSPDGDILINDSFSDSVGCEGEAIELVYSELDVSSVSFQWRRNGIAIGVTGSSYDATQNGYYTCQMQKTGGCSVTSTGYQLTFLPLPVVSYLPSFDTLCSGASSIVLSGGLPAGGSYTINGTTATSLNPASVGAGSHQADYHYTDNNGCTNSAGDNFIIQNCLGIDDQAGSMVKVYPNPFRSEVIISSEKGYLYRVELMDVAGNPLLTAHTKGNTPIFTGNLSRGLYFLRVTDDRDNTAVYRVVKIQTE